MYWRLSNQAEYYHYGYCIRCALQIAKTAFHMTLHKI